MAGMPWAAPVLLGLIAAAPFAVLTASPRLGGAMRAAGLAATPDETARPETLRALDETPGPVEIRGPGAAAAAASA